MRDYEPRERALEPKEPFVWCECSECGQGIYEGETFWHIGAENICSGCLLPFAERFFKEYEELAEKEKIFEED